MSDDPKTHTGIVYGEVVKNQPIGTWELVARLDPRLAKFEILTALARLKRDGLVKNHAKKWSVSTQHSIDAAYVVDCILSRGPHTVAELCTLTLRDRCEISHALCALRAGGRVRLISRRTERWTTRR